MSHMSHTALKTHGPRAVTGLDLDVSTMAIPTTCHGCETGKSTCKPFPGSAKITSRILKVVHSDLAGPMQVKSIQGHLYTATFVDDYSCHAVVYCLRLKDQFVVALQKFLSWAETQTSEKLCTLHSDRGGEYMAASVKDVLNQRGIAHLLTMPGTPQQNRKAEQFNRTTSAKINISYSILFNLTTSYSSYFEGKKGISRNKTSFFLLMHYGQGNVNVTHCQTVQWVLGACH